MKKIYIQPSTKKVSITTMGMIATSGSNPSPTFNPDEETEVMESRRRNNVWDDDEEDDDYGYKLY